MNPDPRIRAYCAQSDVLDADDVTCLEAHSGSSVERRSVLMAQFVHLPTKIEVKIDSDKRGRTRFEAKQGRVEVFLEGIQELERRVRAARRIANRKNAVRHPH